MIKLFTDSTSYIPSDIQVEHNITVLPVTVVLNGKETYETAISNDQFYAQIRKSGKPPKTKALSPDEIADAFEKEISDGNTVIGIFLSARASETYKNAMTAKQKLMQKYPKANITIVDTRSVGMKEGLAVLAAAEAIEKGSWLEDIVSAAEDSVHHTRFIFVPETLKYLEISGRIGKARSLLASAFQITPIIAAQDGDAVPIEVIRIKSKAINRMLEMFEKDIKAYGVKNVVIQHIDCINEALDMAQRAEEISHVEVTICDIGAAMGANVGPGAIGIVYRTEEPMPDMESSVSM